MRNNVTVNKLNGALGRKGLDSDAAFGLVLSAPAISNGMQNGVSYVFKSIRDAMAIGITEAYDKDHSVLVYHHIDRFFQRNPNGLLYFLAAPQSQSLKDMADLSKDHAKKLLKEQAGKIKFVGIARNPLPDYTPVLANGLDADVLDAVAKAQALYNAEFAEFRYASFLIEGRSFNETAVTAKDLRTLNAPNVSVTIGADPGVNGRNPAYSGYAAVGDVLGLLSLAAVSQNAGELNAQFNLSDPGRDMFLTAGLSSGQNINALTTADLDLLNDKGYLFPDVIPGIDGFYLNDTPTCSPLQDNDYAYIENNRTIEKAIFLARTALLPQVKSRLKVDSMTGQLQDEDRKALEATGKKAIERMQDDGDISGGIECYIDPDQNLLAGEPLVIELAFTPVSIARQIVLSIGFSNPFKS